MLKCSLQDHNVKFSNLAKVSIIIKIFVKFNLIRFKIHRWDKMDYPME